MTAETEAVTGYSLADSSAAIAVQKRRLGSLPMCLPLGCCDIGEAILNDSRRVLITWGRNVPPTGTADSAGQHWFAHATSFQPVWLGAEDGTCELILCDSFGGGELQEWIWSGLRISSADGPAWLPC